jgi:hypothetical protein
MKRALTILAALTLLGCAKDDVADVVPTVPVPATQLRTMLWGMVVNESGGCIPGASVQVVRGQAAGQTIVQTTPCAAWDYGDVGFVFKDVLAGVEMTIRSSAPGYAPQEKTFVPTSSPITPVFLTPSRIP